MLGRRLVSVGFEYNNVLFLPLVEGTGNILASIGWLYPRVFALTTAGIIRCVDHKLCLTPVLLEWTTSGRSVADVSA